MVYSFNKKNFNTLISPFENKTIQNSNTNLEGLTYIFISVTKLIFSVYFFFIYFPKILCSPFCRWAHESFCLSGYKYSLLPFFLIHSLAVLFFFISLFFHSHVVVSTFHALAGNHKKMSFDKHKNTEQH